MRNRWDGIALDLGCGGFTQIYTDDKTAQN